MTDNARKETVLGLLESYMPKDWGLKRTLQVRNNLAKDDLKSLVGYLYDGLAYGNWPW